MTLDSETSRAVRGAIDVCISADEAYANTPPDEPLSIHGLGNDGVAFVGADAVHALRLAVLALSSSAIVDGGLHTGAAQTLVVEACRIARKDGIAAAEEYVESVLSVPPTKWVVAERIAAHIWDQPEYDPIPIGRCYLARDILWLGEGDSRASESDVRDFQPAVLVTSVDAHEKESARWRASEAFLETRAVMLLASASPNYGVMPGHLVVREDGDWSIDSGSLEPTLIVRLISKDGRLWPGYRQLANAAARDFGDRTDWEKRVLSAAVWYQTALLTTWPAFSLVAAVSALEALLTFATEKVRKDQIIAKRLVERHTRVEGIDDDGIEDWFVELHGQWRNRVAHQGSRYADERQIKRLLDLTRSVIEWAIRHLDPSHRCPEGPCESVAEVLAAHVD